MKTKHLLLPLLALAGFVAGCSDTTPKDIPPAVLLAAGQLVEPTDKDAAWLAKARAAYPLKTCVISQEELGSMGEPTEMIYRVAGQPDRLVRFCCESCFKDFMQDPAAALKRIDDPGSVKTAPAEKHHH